MELVIGKYRLSLNKDFKPKSLTQFKKRYSSLGSEEELKEAYDKLYGNDTKSKKKVRKIKSKSDIK